jgi:hypothetical protein
MVAFCDGLLTEACPFTLLFGRIGSSNYEDLVARKAG